MAKITLKLEGPRPYFAEVPYYLWGQVNYDSDGDSRRPTDQDWDSLYLNLRGTDEDVEIWCNSGECTIEAPDESALRVAHFLIDRCDAEPDGHLPSAGAWDHEAGLARAAAVEAEFCSPLLSPFDNHGFWISWKWIGCEYGVDSVDWGRLIMYSLLRKDLRAVWICIDGLKCCQTAELAMPFCHALKHLTGEKCDSRWDWLYWYNGFFGLGGSRRQFPKPDLDAWSDEIKEEFRVCDLKAEH